MEMLGNSMKKYVMTQDKKGYSKQVQNVYNNRIKKYSQQALRDLTLLAQKLPEEQQAEIFNAANVGPLIQAILKIDNEAMSQLGSNPSLRKQKREQLLPLCYEMVSFMNTSSLSHLLAPVGTTYMIREGGHLAYLKAIYYRGFNSKDDEELAKS